LVTGTNGKSTVTSLVAAALTPAGDVASNRTGANMPDGILTSLMDDRASSLAALEVDEVYLQPVVQATRPRAILALNLSREYTRGISLARTIAHWRSVSRSLDRQTTVVANVDDPLVQWAFEEAPNLTPVAGGLHWLADAVVCPACSSRLEGLGGAWSCPGCGRSRREPLWWANDGQPVSPTDQRVVVSGPHGPTAVRVTIPGRAAASAAMFALAAADTLRIDHQLAADAVAAVVDVDGRYVPLDVDGRQARILMLKNPAGWAEAIDLAVSSRLPMVVAVEPFGPRDMTTVWEAPWERLSGCQVTVSGTRAVNVVACLESSGVAAVMLRDPVAAVAQQSRGIVLLACNYPAFRQLAPRLRAGST
jgi:UDP-N-acetylmuramyl tripeptide synthase